jgi:SAM-dependent methyltransferase
MIKPNYAGIMAYYYDELYKEKPYKKEAEFIHTKIQQFLGKGDFSILELACGSGTHSILLSEYGYNILATDRSEEFLEIARKKSKSKKLQFSYMDMQNPTEVGRFDIVICLFDSLGYLLNNENISRVFKYVKSVLRPNGLFIFEYWHASAFLKNFESCRYKYLENINLHRISNTEINYLNQYASVHYKFFSTEGYYEEIHRNRFFLPQEMNLFIEYNGFELCNRFAGYTDSSSIDDNTWHILDIIKPK